jgi:hypothetical protein
MATINVPAQTITAGVEKDSPSTTLPAGITAAKVRLTDPGGVWAATVGNVTVWGVQASADNFATWRWLAFSRGIPFGTLERDGGLPSVAISSDGLVAAAGERVRLGILTDAGIVLGATITTTP